MKRTQMRRYSVAVVVGLAIFLGPASSPAEAYIDPGTGSSLFSSLGLLLAAVGTGIAIGFSQLRRCGGWLVTKYAARRKPEREVLTPDLASGKHRPGRGLH